jgi:uncharacterized protein
MNIRRLLLDVDKAMARPSIVEIAGAIDGVDGVSGLDITVIDIDVETVSMDVTIEGDSLDYETLVKAIEKTGAVVHSVYQLAAGTTLVKHIPRAK